MTITLLNGVFSLFFKGLSKILLFLFVVASALSGCSSMFQAPDNAYEFSATVGKVWDSHQLKR